MYKKLVSFFVHQVSFSKGLELIRQTCFRPLSLPTKQQHRLVSLCGRDTEDIATDHSMMYLSHYIVGYSMHKAKCRPFCLHLLDIFK